MEFEKWPVLYNAANTVDLPIDEGEVLPEVGPQGDESKGTHLEISRSTNAVLDGNVEFYEYDEDTGSRRQRSPLLTTQLTAALIEPFSSGDVRPLTPEIAGQEVWVARGNMSSFPAVTLRC